jgi:hypothetical protein
MDDRSHNTDFSSLKIKIAPTPAEQFALTKARSGIQKDQGPGQSVHTVQKSPNFIDIQNVRCFTPLGALANKVDGIAVEELISASMVVEDTHDVPDLRAGGTGEGKLPQPMLHFDGLNLVELAISPLRDDPALEIVVVAFLGGVSLPRVVR